MYLKHAKSGGFTLIEILITIGLLSVIGLIGSTFIEHMTVLNIKMEAMRERENIRNVVRSRWSCPSIQRSGILPILDKAGQPIGIIDPTGRSVFGSGENAWILEARSSGPLTKNILFKLTSPSKYRRHGFSDSDRQLFNVPVHCSGSIFLN